MSLEVINEFFKVTHLDVKLKSIFDQLMIDDEMLYVEIIHDITKVVTKAFTIEEMKELNHFLNTDVGQKWFNLELDLFKDIETVITAHLTISECQQKLSLLSLSNTNSEIN
jgi:hypothetical protein